MIYSHARTISRHSFPTLSLSVNKNIIIIENEFLQEENIKEKKIIIFLITTQCNTRNKIFCSVEKIIPLEDSLRIIRVHHVTPPCKITYHLRVIRPSITGLVESEKRNEEETWINSDREGEDGMTAREPGRKDQVGEQPSGLPLPAEIIARV